MKVIEEDRKRREYEADVEYEVWRSGGNPDAVNLDRVDDGYYAGDSVDETASAEIARARARREEGR